MSNSRFHRCGILNGIWIPGVAFFCVAAGVGNPVGQTVDVSSHIRCFSLAEDGHKELDEKNRRRITFQNDFLD